MQGAGADSGASMPEMCVWSYAGATGAKRKLHVCVSICMCAYIYIVGLQCLRCVCGHMQAQLRLDVSYMCVSVCMCACI